MSLFNTRHSQSLSSLVFAALFIAAELAGCKQCTSPASFVPLLSPTSVLLSTSAPAPILPEALQNDVMLLSVEENGYAHLFAYTPGKLSLTRLTSGDWSDVTPALSPNGKSIAFASNRGGHWDIYTMDLQSGQISQLTNTPEYDSSPTWSPDLAWIAYETYQKGNLEIGILSLTKPGAQPILLTDDPASDHSPAWSPDGRHIAFVSDRTGDADIWLADLNKTQDRFTDISQSPQAEESHPAWSPDGGHLAWASSSQADNYSGIYAWDGSQPLRSAIWVGDGNWPAWNMSGDAIVTAVDAPNQELLAAFTLTGQPLLLTTPLPGQLHGLVWPTLALPAPLPQSYQEAAAQTPTVLWDSGVTPVAGVPAQRWYVVPLQHVQAPFPQLHAQVAGSFNALRRRVTTEAGWDALGSLQNAYIPLTTALDPGLGEDWLYTGRAFAINSLMVNAGWMVVAREDIGAQTYWRLYLRAQNQDGSQGEPVQNPPWDLNARYQLDPKSYEAGGAYTSTPPGYWIDFTSLAAAYGWERLPSLSDWRNYYSGARFTEFALTGGLDWYLAMLQLYPVEALFTATAVLPPTATPSKTPIPTSTPGPSRTPLATLPSSTASLTPTPRPPTNTPLPTPTPPTIIPTFKP